MGHGAQKAGLILAGILMGLLAIAIGLWFYLQAARVNEIRTGLGDRLRIARDAIERIDIVAQDALRFTLRDVAVLDARGDTIFAAPRLLMTLDATTLEGEGAIEFYDVRLADPFARLIMSPDGEWNFFRPFSVTARGQPVEAEGRPLVFRDVRIDDGRIVLAIPGQEPEQEGRFAINLPITRLGDVPYQLYEVSDVQARLPRVRIGGPEGWRAELASASAEIREPNIRIAELQGFAEQAGEDGVRFDVGTLRFASSVLAGAGLIRFSDEGILYDVEVQADPIRLADLNPIFPNLEDEGSASFDLAIRSLTADRLSLAFRELDFEGYDSRILGSVDLAIGGELPLALLDANLQLAPLRLLALEELGLVEEMPLTGQVVGSISTRGAAAGRATVDLRATVVPRDDPGATPSVILAEGALRVGDAFESLQLDGVTVGFRPLHLATLRGFAPEMADRLRGTVEGSVDLAGTFTDLRMTDGLLTYTVGDAPPSRFADFEGRISLEPELAYDIGFLAQPLALATLTELFPGLPFREASVSGPIRLVGDPEGLRVSADLQGAAGGIRFAGSAAFAEPTRFEVEGDLTAFAAGMILRPEVPAEGPLSGRFAARGTTDHFEFDVDLTQMAGRFILQGSVTPAVDPPRFQASGRVIDFRVGALVGDPQLFPDPMTGDLSIAGGGGDPYAFDVDLTGASGRLDLAGFYQPGPVPSYEARGVVVGLDISRLPTPSNLPQSSLTASVDIRGRGTELATLEGTFAFDATNSRFAGMPVDAAIGRIDIRGGIAYVDTLHVLLERTRLVAAGSWGLLSPAPEPLRFSLSSPDLSVLNRLFAAADVVPPQVAGSVEAVGTVGGSVENPIIQTALQGRNLRYQDYRAAALTLDVDAVHTPGIGWQGDLSLDGSGLFTPQFQAVESLRLEASGNEGALSFSFSARRDPQTDLVASGFLELDGLAPQGAALDALTLRLDDVQWELEQPARIRFRSDLGLFVENLVLERSGPVEGRVVVNGSIPPTGVAALSVQAVRVDLSDLRRLSPTLPDLDGLLTLDAVLEGPVSSPEMSITARVDQLRYEGAEAEEITFDGAFAGRQLVGSAAATVAGQRLFTADLSIPMTLSVEGLIPSFELLMDEPTAMSIVADSLPLALVAALAPGLVEGEGVARAQVQVAGTLDVPELDGWVRLNGGALTIEPLAARYTDIEADIALARNRILINSLSATSGGTVVVGGSVDFPPGSPPILAITAGLDDFRVMDDPQVARLVTSGQLALTGPLSGPVLTGNLEVRESTIRVPELGQTDPVLELDYLEVGQLGPVPGEAFGAESGPPLLGNILVDGLQLSIAESVWLESNEMRVQITGDLILYRQGEDLRIFGALQAVRGTYALEISGIVREFDVIRGRVQFFGTGEINPSLDILAGYRVRGGTVGGRGGDLTILVQLSGSMLSPRVQLGSDTPVPLAETDLISYLLFGQPSFELGGFTRGFAEQLLVQELVGNLLASELQRPILRAGLCDWVRVRPGLTTDFRGFFGGSALAGAMIECGWELANDLFLTAQTGLGILGGELNEGRIGLEWQIDQQWLWEASYGTVPRNPLMRMFDASRRTQFSTDIRRHWEYGRPTQRSLLDLLPDDPEAPLPAPGLPAAPILEPAQAPARDEDPPPVVAGP